MNLDEWVGCDAVMNGNPKIQCSMVHGESHGPMHKRITKTGRVTHTWPVAPSEDGARRIRFNVSGRLELSGPDGTITWEHYDLDFEAADRNEAQQRFVDIDTAVSDAIAATQPRSTG